MRGVDLTGITFRSRKHSSSVTWIVLRYHRGGAWVCEEQQHRTTCEFYTGEIIEALGGEAPYCLQCKSYHSVPVSKEHWELLGCRAEWYD